MIVAHVELVDPALAAFVAQRAEAERVELVERAVRIGLLAIQDAGASLDVDVVRREFELLLQRSETMNERAAQTLDGVLRANFGDGDGRLPRTLERFLGDRGQLRHFVSELFDESKRDSAIGRMRTLLGSYFDGDASRLAQLLDPTRLGSPLHQFRTEVTEGFARLNDRLTAIEAASSARSAERARSAAKGADFEDLLEQLLADVVRNTNDVIDRTGNEAGEVIRSKKGDFLLTVDPGLCRGADVRVVVEAKDRAVSGRVMREELREAKRNRGAVVGLVVFTPAHAPAGIAPFDVRAGDVYCVIDPQSPETQVLEAAVRLARLHALACVQDAQDNLDGVAISAALAGIRGELDLVRGLKTQLTSIGSTARDVTAGLDRLRQQVLARVAEAEAELRFDRHSPAA
ncbi:MAG TPA: hypothetical protein VK992_03555 [Candidatus Caenarcaniphilales bacterium]|nr:hypothetical protein [Candidatus Caenarcaniphilales bacterium]